MPAKQIAIFASGEGSNAENIILYFKKHYSIKVVMVLSDNPNAAVLNKAKASGILTCTFTKNEFYETDEILNLLKDLHIDLIVLAGFLKKIPENIINDFDGRIINIHPALLPKHGGKGMYGINVHKAVYDSGENETGITIHHVNKNYDEGDIIFQEKIPLDKNDLPEIIMQKVRKLELKYYPEIIEKMLS